MKRKLSAIIALVLAVVMVFPTAVFVGAANADKITVSLTGGIKDDGYLAAPIVNAENSAQITLALTGKATGTISIPSGYSNVKVTNTTGNDVAKVTISKSNITVQAAKDFPWDGDTDKFEITATKTVINETTEKEETLTVKFTLTVKVVPVKIIDFIMYGSSDSEWFGGAVKKLTGAEEYNATDSLTIEYIDVLYNYAEEKYTERVSVNENNLLMTITNTNQAEGNRTNKDSGVTMALLGDDVSLTCKYTDADNNTHTETIDLHVTTSSVQYVDIHRYIRTIKSEDEITEENFLSAIEAEVKLKEHSSSLWYTGEQVKNKADGKFSIKYYEDSQNKAELSASEIADYRIFKEAFFVVQYEDAFYKSSEEALRIKDYFVLQDPVPVDVKINWDKAAKTEYYEGYVIGTDPKDWTNVEVYVRYAAEDSPAEYARINGVGEYIESGTYAGYYRYKNVADIVDLDLVLSPINARQKFVTIESIMGYEMNIASNLPTKFNLLYSEVIGISIDSSTTSGKLSYTEGDTLNLSGIKAILEYNFGEDVKRNITNDEFTCNPKHGDKLTTDDTEVLIVYKDPNTKKEISTSFEIEVDPKPEEAKEIKKIQLLSSNGAKRDYFIGEAFDPEGFEFLLVYSDASTDVKDLSDYKSGLTVDSNKYNNSSKQFTAALDGDLKVNFSITYSGTKYNVSLTIPNITVTKRPVLESISVNADKVDYLEGEAPQVKDFVITAKYDDKSQRVFEVADDVTGANRTTYSTTTGGVTYTVKLTPTMVEGDTTKIRVTYSEKVSNTAAVSKYADVEIDVTIPDAILTYYDTTERTYITKAYEDLLDALDKAEEIADSYGSTYASRIPELELRRDVTMVSDFPTTESLNIDLNGHVLTMIRGEIYVSSRASTGVEVVFSNSDKADAKLVYSSDEDDTVIIAYNDTYTIDKSTTNAGKYEVVISAVKNGKVTGPDEVTHGHDAQFTITPNEDYEIATIKVNNKTQSIPTDGKLIVENVQAKLTVTVTFKEKAWDNPFTDVYKSATYYKSVQFVYENGLFNGTSATKFEPDTTMTRAMFVTVLGRLAGVNVDNYRSSSFKDVPTGEWYSEYVEWASSIGLVEGYGNGKFGPNDAITHAQMYVLMQRYAGLIERMNTNVSGVSIPANDVKDIPTWAYEGVEFAAKNSFLVTSSNRLTPNANAKRSELAMLLDRFCTNVLEWDE